MFECVYVFVVRKLIWVHLAFWLHTHNTFPHIFRHGHLLKCLLKNSYPWCAFKYLKYRDYFCMDKPQHNTSYPNWPKIYVDQFDLTKTDAHDWFLVFIIFVGIISLSIFRFFWGGGWVLNNVLFFVEWAFRLLSINFV